MLLVLISIIAGCFRFRQTKVLSDFGFGSRKVHMSMDDVNLFCPCVDRIDGFFLHFGENRGAGTGSFLRDDIEESFSTRMCRGIFLKKIPHGNLLSTRFHEGIVLL